MVTLTPIIAALASTLALSQPQPSPDPVTTSSSEVARAEILETTDGSTMLVAYDADDNVAAEVAISADGIQASIDGVFVDATLEPDGSMAVRCHGECTDTERMAAAVRLSAIGLVVDSPDSPQVQAGKTAGMWCALGIASTAAACVGSSGLLCGVGFAATACACMKEVVINGKDICE